MSFMFEDALTFLSNHLKSLDPTVEVNVYMWLCEIGLELNGGACYSCIQ